MAVSNGNSGISLQSVKAKLDDVLLVSVKMIYYPWFSIKPSSTSTLETVSSAVPTQT